MVRSAGRGAPRTAGRRFQRSQRLFARSVTEGTVTDSGRSISAVVSILVTIPIVLAVAFPLELQLMLALVAAPLAVLTDIVVDDQLLIGPVAGLVDRAPAGAHVARRNPV